MSYRSELLLVWKLSFPVISLARHGDIEVCHVVQSSAGEPWMSGHVGARSRVGRSCSLSNHHKETEKWMGNRSSGAKSIPLPPPKWGSYLPRFYRSFVGSSLPECFDWKISAFLDWRGLSTLQARGSQGNGDRKTRPSVMYDIYGRLPFLWTDVFHVLSLSWDSSHTSDGG